MTIDPTATDPTTIAAAAAAADATTKWFWETYGKMLIDKLTGPVHDVWNNIHWHEVEKKYKKELKKHYSATKVLGYQTAIEIDKIFTDVYVFDKLTAERHFAIEALEATFKEKTNVEYEKDRKPALRIITKEKRLFILGKPGAGKTTLLKFLTIKACAGNIAMTPIFVPLREWAESDLNLLDFIAHQFDICKFPDAKKFLEVLLENGNALVLFDGLDEVNQEGDKRIIMIRTLRDFSRKYENITMCVTCRIAAVDYSFDDFVYLEIADFNETQINSFCRKWYKKYPDKLEKLQTEMAKPENKSIIELAKTPLLLTLLCITFDELGAIPPRRVDLYKEAFDALLQKWDATRGIQRDQLYKRLSPRRKRQLLARIADENFELERYLIQKDKIEAQIEKYLSLLPGSEISDLPDGESILKAIVEQHGILIERSHNIYSFSHLTFQEYLTAEYLVDNAANGKIQEVIGKNWDSGRWEEVFFSLVSMMDSADMFFEVFLDKLEDFYSKSEKSIALLKELDKCFDSDMYKDSYDCVLAKFLILAEGISEVFHEYWYLSEKVFKNIEDDLIPLEDTSKKFCIRDNYISYKYKGFRIGMKNKMTQFNAPELPRVSLHSYIGLRFYNKTLFDKSSTFLKKNERITQAIFKLVFNQEKYPNGINVPYGKDKKYYVLGTFVRFTNLLIYISANEFLLLCLQFGLLADREKTISRFFRLTK